MAVETSAVQISINVTDARVNTLSKSGEPPNDVAWCLIDRCEAPAKLLERFSLYPLDEVT